jgi:ABC-type glycerol-3-phosphate transport system substrate-binding protein
MKTFAFRTALGLSLATVLAACGSGAQVDQPTQTAAMIATANGVQTATANTPAPDCAADGCKSLRIIDANAEAYRYEAMRRAAAEAPQT